MELTGEVLTNQKITLDFYHMKLKVPRAFRSARPGQFLHARIDFHATDPLMRRPISLYRVHKQGKDWLAEILYRAVGHGTEILSTLKPGDLLNFLGPQGNGYQVRSQDRTAIMVAGGYGVGPLYFLSERLLKSKRSRVKDIHVIIGARNKEHLLCVKEFQDLGVQVHVTTNDGSMGLKGVVTDYLSKLLSSKKLKKTKTCVYACGPEAMLKKVAEVSGKHEVLCQISMEERMGCSLGVCMGCICKIKKDRPAKGSLPYRFLRVCTDGPVFEGSKIEFE